MTWTNLAYSALTILAYYSLYFYFHRREQLRLKVEESQGRALAAARALTAAQEKMESDERSSTSTIGRGSVIPIATADDETTGRISHDESVQFAALAELAESDRGSAIPVEIDDPEQTARLSHEESLQLAAQGDLADPDSESAIPVEILDDTSPTRRVFLEESEPAAEPDCRLDGITTLPIEAEVWFADHSYQQRAS